jgi:hypothetical protein
MKRFSTFFVFISLLIAFNSIAFATSYFSQGNLPPNLTSSWNTLSGGGGSAPNNFTSGDVFIVQFGHSMTTTAPWTVSGTNAQILINGGTLTLSHSTTTQQLTISSGDVTIGFSMVTGITLTVNNGNAAGEDLLIGSSGTANLYKSGKLIYGPGATGKVSNAGTLIHTVTINNDSIPVFTWTTFSTCKITGVTATLPLPGGFGQSFGNIIYDCPSQTTNVIMNTAPTTLTNFTINSTGSGSLVLGTNISPSTSLTINGGIFDLSSYTANGLVLASSINIGASATMRIGGSNGFPINYSAHNLNPTSTVEYYGTGTQIVAAEKYGNLTLSGTRGIGSNITLANTDTIYIAGSLTPAATFISGGYVSSGSTVNFNGTSVQTIPGFKFGNLVIGNVAASTFTGGNISVNGILEVRGLG